MSDKETLNELIGRAYDYVSALMIASKHEFMTQFMLLKEDGNYDLIVCPWSNDQEKKKSIVMVGLKIISSEEKVKAYSMISETWMLKCKDNKIPNIRPSESPDRTEAMVAVASDGENHEMHCWPIGRSKDGTCVSLTRDTKPVDGFESWMIEALDKALELHSLSNYMKEKKQDDR